MRDDCLLVESMQVNKHNNNNNNNNNKNERGVGERRTEITEPVLGTSVFVLMLFGKVRQATDEDDLLFLKSIQVNKTGAGALGWGGVGVGGCKSVIEHVLGTAVFEWMLSGEG